jgi:hypothetical protein
LKSNNTYKHKEVRRFGDNGLSDDRLSNGGDVIASPEKGCYHSHNLFKISQLNYCTGFVVLLAQLYSCEIVNMLNRLLCIGTMPEEVKEANGASHKDGGGANTKKTVTMNKSFAPKFEGKCADLKGHVYNCSDDARELDQQFMKTTCEIAEYLGRTYKYGKTD